MQCFLRRARPEDCMATTPPPARTATDFYVPAKGYAESAKIIKLSPLTSGREGMTFLPLHMLVGFSVELHLKAWLTDVGFNEETLRRKPYGHNLNELYGAAKANGLPPIDRLDALVPYLHGPHADFTYRYFRQDITYESMELGSLFGILDALDTVVDSKIGASASIGKAPGH